MSSPGRYTGIWQGKECVAGFLHKRIGLVGLCRLPSLPENVIHWPGDLQPARSLVRYEGIKHPRRTIPSTTPPPILPPINNVSRNKLREWCRYQNLSTDGKKVEVYLRLWKHLYANQECYIPNTNCEARQKLVCKKPKIVFRGIGPPSSCQSQKHERSILEIVTSPQASTLAAWRRIAMRAALSMSMNRHPLMGRPFFHKPLDSDGVLSTAGSALQIRMAGFACNFMLVKPGFQTLPKG